MILNYDSVKNKPDTLLAMTSLNKDEFEELSAAFDKVWHEKTEQDKKDPAKGGRKPILNLAEDRLFFILFYLKTYPLQEVLAHWFGMSQGQANFLIDPFSEILKETFKRGGHLPARLPEELLQELQDEEPQDLGIDGTERRIERPADADDQKKYYRGRKKAHTLKNVMVGGLNDRRVKYLSGTHEGKMHDKKVCDEDQMTVPSGSDLYQDTGFQGYEIPGVKIHQPMKKPPKGELMPADRLCKRFISKFRVAIEHIIGGVKRCRIVKDVFRNTQRGYEDTVMELACALDIIGN